MRSIGYPSTVSERSVDQPRRVAPPMTKTIPFDYVFEFKLSGKPANNVQDVVKLQDVVEISMQGVFVGVSIGYSFVLDERRTPRRFGPVLQEPQQSPPSSPPGTPIPITIFAAAQPGRRASEITLGEIAAGLANVNVDLASGFRFSQRFANIFAADPALTDITDILAEAFEPACGPEDVSFLYSIDVLSSGRELQNKPIHNIAGLGIANGDRPFRPFARPIAFEPRSFIRIQIEELSTLPGTLYIVLQGYKILGTARIPE